MENLLAGLHAVESVALGVLIWRTLVADKERHNLLMVLRETQDWIKSLAMELLRKTDLK